jgi:hypothetical protein
MSNRPKKIWMITPGHSDTPRRMYEKTGGKYTRVDHLLNQVEVLIRNGYSPTVYEADLDWREVPLDELY